MRLPRIFGAVLASQALETRDARWFTVTQAMAGSAGTPTDAQLTALMNENADQLRMPESRTASVVLFDDGAAAPAELTEARILERFNFRRDALSLPERRSFVTLTAPDRAAADRIAAALRAGQSPADVARANSIQPAEYVDTPRSALGDPAVAAAVFGLAGNEVSAPVRASVGFVVARVNAIQPGRAATLADVRDQVVAELRAEDARAAVYRRVEAYEKARQDGKTLDVAVREVGARLIQIPAIRQDGKLRNGQEINPALPPQLLQGAPQGVASPLQARHRPAEAAQLGDLAAQGLGRGRLGVDFGAAAQGWLGQVAAVGAQISQLAGEYQAFHQGVAGQPVGPMHAGAGHLPYGI
jgi:peptidyl-prolyl cis-trans isomerase D